MDLKKSRIPAPDLAPFFFAFLFGRTPAEPEADTN